MNNDGNINETKTESMMETEEEQLRIARNKTWDFYTKLIIAGAIIWNVIMFIVVYLWQDGPIAVMIKLLILL